MAIANKTIINLSLLESYQGINIYGAVSGSAGYSVSSAGDINNDGYDDFMIGSPYANSYSGISYILYGNQNLATTINLVQIESQGLLISGTATSYSGTSVANIGDVNSDGYADISICAPNIGTAYIIYGEESPSNLNLANLISVQGFYISNFLTSSDFAYSVAGVGDVNGDGYDDVIINYDSYNTAIFYVIYGSIALKNIDLANITASQGFAISGTLSTSDFYVNSAAGARDVNGDGYDDIIIGAPYANNYAGIAYVIYGGIALNNINLTSMTSLQGFYIAGIPNSCSGFAVAGAGDMNYDNYDDVIIGAPCANNHAGISYVIYGGIALNNINLTSMTSLQGFSVSGTYNSFSGYSVAGAGDVNGDGIDDVIIGAPDANTYAGVSYVIFGGENPGPGNIDLSISNTDTMNTTSSGWFAISGAPTFSYSGSSVAGAGDINNDGYDDIIIGAQYANNYAGVSYVVYGGFPLYNIDLAKMTFLRGFSIAGITNSNSGASVAGAGDINNDGYDDIIIGAPYADLAGISYVVYGNIITPNINLVSMTSSQGFSIAGGVANGDSGFSVAGAGDVNGDGYDDIIISILQGAYVIYGGPILINLNLANSQPQGFLISGMTTSLSDCNVAGVGDINNDGYDDIIIGDPNANNNAGKSYVIYGGSVLNNIDVSILTPTRGYSISGQANSFSGYSVAAAGDVNKDGFPDIIIGAPYANNNAGKTYVIYGNLSFVDLNLNTSVNNLNLATLSTTQGFYISGITNSYNGYSVSGVGDINNDGFLDIVIGAPGANNYAGVSYVVYGDIALNNINLTSMTSLQGFSIQGITNSYCGYSVAGAGDVNNDSYPDLVIGAPYTNNYAGESYVIYGSSSLSIINLAELPSEQGFYITSAQGYSQCGFSVAGAGDVNGDGYDDVIIGAPNFVYDNSIAGAAFVVYGAASGFETLSPTPAPSTAPTPEAATTPWYDTIEFKYASSAGLSLLSFISAWLVRNKIAMYILDNWGHEFKLYNRYVPLKENEIGISLKDDKLVCIVKFHEYPLLDEEHDSQGISKLLYKAILQAIENPLLEQSFTFKTSEKNQIQNYLISHNYLKTSKTCGCIKTYTELGYFKGSVYSLTLSQFGAQHRDKALEKDVRTGVEKEISMQEISSASMDDSVDNKLMNPVLKDLEVGRNSLETSGFSINSKFVRHSDESADHLCMDALMSPGYIDLREQRFGGFVKRLTYAAQETIDSHSKFLALENDISSSPNIDFPYISHFAQTALEYSSTIRYFSKLLGIDLPKVDLPNEIWAGVHFAAGMIKVSGDTALSLGQMIESGSYYARLELYDMLAEANTDEKLSDLISFAQACSKHIAIGGVLGLASGAPVYGAINGAAICLNQHQMLAETDTQTTVRYAVDTVAGVAALYGLADQDALTQVIGIVNTVSMSDITARVGMATVELELNGVSE